MGEEWGMADTAMSGKWFAKASVAAVLAATLGLTGCGSSSESAKETKPAESSKQSGGTDLSLIHISEPTRLHKVSRMPSSA